MELMCGHSACNSAQAQSMCHLHAHCYCFFLTPKGLGSSPSHKRSWNLHPLHQRIVPLVSGGHNPFGQGHLFWWPLVAGWVWSDSGDFVMMSLVSVSEGDCSFLSTHCINSSAVHLPLLWPVTMADSPHRAWEISWRPSATQLCHCQGSQRHCGAPLPPISPTLPSWPGSIITWKQSVVLVRARPLSFADE